jgi:2-polyprenyl-3-methyl-5-hydroxy-6-metoxy-1,4-benzoquinol methylase
MATNLRRLIEQRRNRKLYSTEAYWNFKAAEYQGKGASMWPNLWLNELYDREQRRLISQHLKEIRGAEMLDLGCGVGRFSRWFAEQGASVTGMDFSAGALAIAREQSSGGNPMYRQSSVFAFDDVEAYDSIFVWGVLCVACVDRNQLLDAMKRIRRAVRPGGRLMITEPVHSGFLHRTLKLGLREFLVVMQEAGFEVETVSPLQFWPMRLALCNVSWPKWLTASLYHLGRVAMKLPGLNRLADYWAIMAAPAVRT